MFRLEKVFQNDDSGFIYFITFIKTFVLFLSIYLFSILQNYSIYEIFEFEIFKKSNFYLYSFLIIFFYFIISFVLKNKRFFQRNFISFLKEDLSSIIIANICTFSIFFLYEIKFIVNFNFFILIIVNISTLLLLKFFSNYLYDDLIAKNIIQKNIMLVGTLKEIKKVLNEKFDKIFVFKCCMISDLKNQNVKLVKSEIKFPIFHEDEDIRSILEYHSLGQIWILNGNTKNNNKIFNKIIKFSVDTLNIKLERSQNLRGEKLLANKYEYEFYEWSRFFGINLFVKILIDKILSIIFILIASPLLLLSSLAIYIEDGFPILFTQNRTGWDGRRFKIYKLRSLKRHAFDKTKQVRKDDERLLKIGKILRRYSIDELPQFFNVLNGDMSIVGPRPHMVEHDIHYSNLFNNFLKRHKCNPGLTGWAQVNGLRGATPDPEIMKRRMEFDLWYLNNWNIFLDIYIIIKTFYAVIKYKGD
ncbi:exopolysaccharide biosynthesis polyprenyl glycosylphosphotransferase [Candidatus Pelagibacter communis]|uniref:exopolysaccharide biosynthesis polyprenyl glycosylphosphotransferase n=1 Tax=Pelagibacter ubique TaxID=198252 RepID=UPI000AC284D9|nr:exopolysaccharide biosynthesis polyprenyl glycosylphosphotransferase [Candidatus Pelagibacter ubique]